MKIPSLIHKFCDAVWEYDADTNRIYLHYDTMTPQFCGRWLPYGMIDCMYRENYVHPLDQVIWEHFLTTESLKRFINKETEEDHFYIRFEHTQHGNEWHEVYIQRMEDKRLLLASRDVKEMQRNAAIAQAVVPEFDYVCCIDIAEQSYVLYYSDANNTIVPQSASDDYNRILEEFNREYVVEEEAEELTRRMRLEVVQKELEDKEEYILYTTVKENGGEAYKKLRFSYESEARDRLLLTRTDVGEIVKERKLRDREREKQLRYLENMPVAFCSTRVLVDEEGKPYDFQFTYSNRAHAKLEEVEEGELIGKNFYEFFGETDPQWLQYYYETAYKGIAHVIRRYSPEVKKHLEIYTFQSEPGCCECVVLDVSEHYFLTQELEGSRENMKRILRTTTDLVFEYSPEREELIVSGNGEKKDRVLTRELLHRKFMKEELFDDSYGKKLEECFLRIKNGEHSVSAVVRGRLRAKEKQKWYRVTMFDFLDSYTHKRKILGYLQNIDQEMSKQEEFRKRAETDSLTGVFNAGTGKHKICKKLEKKQDTDRYFNAMFVTDMDNFKKLNDTKGHFAGDQALVEFAQVLRRTFRADDVIYRLGGDEFVVFVEKIYEPDQSIGVILDRFYTNMEEARKTCPFLKCSMGIFFTDKKHSFDEYYKAADKALYETKNSGKGYYTIRKDA